VRSMKGLPRSDHSSVGLRLNWFERAGRLRSCADRCLVNDGSLARNRSANSLLYKTLIVMCFSLGFAGRLSYASRPGQDLRFTRVVR
jgi:hypothetical protein